MSQPPEPPAEGPEHASEPRETTEPTQEIPEPPPPLYQAPPRAQGQPPPGYGQPPPSYGQPPPSYGQPPPGYGQPPPGYGQPPPGSGQPPPSYGYPPQAYPVAPQKQSHVLRNVLLILVGLLVLGCGGCFAVVGLGINQANKAIDKAQENDHNPGGPANPIEVQEGQPFTINGMRFLSGWRVDSTGAAGTTIENLQVTHHRKGDNEVTELVTFKFYRHQRVLWEANCAATPLGFGETGVVSCTPAGRVLKHYDRITVNDTF